MKQLIPRAYAPGIFFNQIFLYSPQSFSYCHSALHHGDVSDTPKTALYHFRKSSADHIPEESMYQYQTHCAELRPPDYFQKLLDQVVFYFHITPHLMPVPLHQVCYKLLLHHLYVEFRFLMLHR